MSNDNKNGNGNGSGLLGADGKPMKTSANFDHSFHTVSIKDPGKNLGFAGNMAYGGSRVMFYMRHPGLLFTRSAGALGASLVALVVLLFVFNLVFGRSKTANMGTIVQPLDALSGAAADGLRQPLGAARDRVGEVVAPGAAQAQPQQQDQQQDDRPTSFPNGIQAPQQ